MSKIIAHRGFSSMAPENSLQAIKKALEYDYIDGIEIDVRMTKDKKLVLIHDQNIKRISNGKGFVKDYTLEELQKYNFHTNIIDRRFNYLKSFLNPKGHKIRMRIKEYRNTITKLSTLEDIIKLFDNKKTLLIELKKEDTDYNDFLESLIKILIHHKNKKIYIQSFNTDLLKKLKEKCSFVKIGILIGRESNLTKIDMPFDFISLNHQLINKYLVDEIISKQSKELMLWTVDNQNQYHKITKKIGNINRNMYLISNYPDYIYEIENKK